MKRTKKNMLTNLNVRLTEEFMNQMHTYTKPNGISLSEFAREAIEKAIPKNVVLDELCPYCKTKVAFEKVYPSSLFKVLNDTQITVSNYCHNCGNALDWSRYEINENKQNDV